MLKSTRQIDVVSRWGGEEFIVFCPNTQVAGSRELGEKILTAIQNFEFDTAKTVTASLGVATYKQNDSTESIVNKADS